MPGTNYTHILDEITEAASRNRGDMAQAMRDVDPSELNEARAEDAVIRQRLGAISDGRAYGPGCDFDARGIRPLKDLGETVSGSTRYTGPYHGPYHAGQPTHQDKSAHYPAPKVASNRVEPFWGGDSGKPAVDHSGGRRRRQ